MRLIAALGAMALALSAHAGADEIHPVITVTGTGTARAAPDQARFRVGANVLDERADSGLAQANRIIARVREALAARGIVPRNIKTVQFSVAPQYAPRQRSGAPPPIIGYRVTHLLDVAVDDLDGLGALLDLMISSGANVLDRIAFAVRRPEPVLDEARRRAVDDATRRATVIARAANRALGPISAIREGRQGPVRPLGRVARLSLEAGSASAVAPGQSEFRASVTIEFQLK